MDQTPPHSSPQCSYFRLKHVTFRITGFMFLDMSQVAMVSPILFLFFISDIYTRCSHIHTIGVYRIYRYLQLHNIFWLLAVLSLQRWWCFVNGSKFFFPMFDIMFGKQQNDKVIHPHARFCHSCNMQCVFMWVSKKIKLTLGNRGFH